MYQVIARKYRPQTFQDVVNQEHVKTTLENAISQNRIAHGYIFSGQRGTGKTTIARILARCLNCIQGPTATPVRGVRELPGDHRRRHRGRDRNRRRLESRHQRDARAARERPLPAGARPLQDFHRRRSPPDHQRGLQRAAQDHRRAAAMGGLRALHHRSAQDSGHHRLALPAFQLPLGGFRRPDRPHGLDLRAGRHRGRSRSAGRARAGRRRQRARFALRPRPGYRLLRLEAGRGRRPRAARRVLARIAREGDAGARRKAIRAACWRWWTNWNATATTCSTSAASCRATFATCWWRVSPERKHAWWRPRAAQRQKLAEIAARFSEEDLTRYLQLSLDLFSDLQFSLQPRFHLEIGLVRLVQAGRLLPIEQALAGLRRARRRRPPDRPPLLAARSPQPPPAPPARTGPSPFELDRAKKSASRPPEPQSSGANALAPEPAPVPMAAGDARQRLHAWLVEQGHSHLADAVENARIEVSGADLNISAPKSYARYFRDRGFEAAVRAVFGRPLRLNLTAGEAPVRRGAPRPGQLRARRRGLRARARQPRGTALPRSFRRRNSKGSQSQGVGT